MSDLRWRDMGQNNTGLAKMTPSFKYTNQHEHESSDLVFRESQYTCREKGALKKSIPVRRLFNLNQILQRGVEESNNGTR